VHKATERNWTEMKWTGMQRAKVPKFLTEWSTCVRQIGFFQSTLVSQFSSVQFSSIALYTAQSRTELNWEFLVKIALAQAISPIATHFSVAWSVVCRLSVVCHTRACTLLKPFDGFSFAIWHVHLRGLRHIVLHGCPWPTIGKGRFGGLNPLSPKLHLWFTRG